MTERILTRERLLEIFKCYEHLPVSENIEVTILKGHLLIESRLIEYIQRKIDNPSVFESDKLRFAQLLMVAHSLCNEEEYADLWVSIQKLNLLRNRLSHKLDQVLFENALNDFLDFHSAHFFQGQGIEYRNIHSCVVSIYSSLIHLIAEKT